jgi:ABC-type sugar transport system permease subunit
VFSFAFLFLFPAIYSLALSFYRYKGYGDARYVGLSNYQVTFSYHVFWTMLRNTTFYWLMHALPLMVLSFLLASLVSSPLVRWKSFYKPMIYLPNVVAAVASGLLFQSMFGTQYGVLNRLLGIQVPWLERPEIARWVIVALIIWQRAGWWFVIFLAGLTSINPEVEEAALVDGANGWQRMWRVTVPLMQGTFLFAFVMDAIGSFRLFAEPNTLMARGGSLAPNEVAPLLNLLLINLRSAAFGQAAAVGWILFVIVVAISLAQFRLFADRTEAEGA